jgi:hypothetical protein
LDEEGIVAWLAGAAGAPWLRSVDEDVVEELVSCWLRGELLVSMHFSMAWTQLFRMPDVMADKTLSPMSV